MPRNDPVLPPLPGYGSQPSTTPVGASGYDSGALGGGSADNDDPRDVWDLGNLYGVPIYMGYTPGRRGYRPPQSRGHKDDPHWGEGSRPQQNQYPHAEDVFTDVYNTWVRGTSGDKKAYADYKSLQRLLHDAGFFGQTALDKVHVGQWGQQTQDALKDALTAYSRASKSGSPLTFTEFLKRNAAASEEEGGFYDDAAGGGGGGGPQGPTLADPETLRINAQEAAQAALGRSLSPDELSSFVDQFHQKQITQYNTAVGGGTTEDADPRADAIKFVTSQHGEEYQKYQVQGYANAFLNMLLGGTDSEVADIQVEPTLGV